MVSSSTSLSIEDSNLAKFSIHFEGKDTLLVQRKNFPNKRSFMASDFTNSLDIIRIKSTIVDEGFSTEIFERGSEVGREDEELHSATNEILSNEITMGNGMGGLVLEETARFKDDERAKTVPAGAFISPIPSLSSDLMRKEAHTSLDKGKGPIYTPSSLLMSAIFKKEFQGTH